MSARRESKVDAGFSDTRFSSGDSNTLPQSSQGKKKVQEENNNDVDDGYEVDALSEELQMGCIVDAVKRPPNICVENCVYEESDDGEDHDNTAGEDAYSEEFEEDTEPEDDMKLEPKPAKSATSNRTSRPPSALKLSKSHSAMSSKMKSTSGGSRSDYGSISVPATRRVNMSFTNERLREIERHNRILLGKIIASRNKNKSSIPKPEPPEARRPPPPAAARRKKQQRQIDHDNMILLRKIQTAKSSACSMRR